MLVNLSKATDIVAKLEEELKSARASYLPTLEKQLAPQQARLEIATLADLLVRLAFGKPYPVHMNLKSSGKFTPEKIKTLKEAWAKTIDDKYPDLLFTTATGLASLNADGTSKAMGEIVDPRSLKRLKSDDDDDAAEEGEGGAASDWGERPRDPPHPAHKRIRTQGSHLQNVIST